MSIISERAMLASLNVSQWTARRLDKQETAALNSSAQAVEGAARVNKSLLPTSMNLVNLQKKTGAVRTYFYEQTRPWAMDGPRIFPSANYMTFTDAMRDHINEWKSLKNKFLNAYDDDVTEAQRSLGSMFKPEDYPSRTELEYKFNISLAFMPVPDERDWRVDLADEEVERLRANVEMQVQAGVSKAMEENWQQVADVIRRAHKRLSDPKGVFRDTLVENAVQLVNILPSMNLTDDPELERVRRELEKTLASHNPQTLRDAPAVRQQVSDKLAKLDAEFGHLFPNN